MKLKVFFSILILIVFVKLTKGQEYVQLIKPDTSIWLIAHAQMAGKYIDTVFAKSKVNAYTEIWYKGIFYNNKLTYCGKIRSNTDHSKLWYILPDDTTETLIFDMNLEIGDTFNFGNYYDIVDTVFFVNNLKYIEFKNLKTGWDENVRFIEGVGPSNSIVSEWAILYPGMLNPYTVCKYENDSLFYVNQNPNFIGCEFNTIGLHDQSRDKFKIYPNPVNGYLIIEVPLQYEPIHFILFDLKGQTIKQSHLRTENSIDMSELAQGVYILKLVTGYNVYYERIIKI